MPNLSVDELKQIKKESCNIKPHYRCGEFVFKYIFLLNAKNDMPI
jgi:hypothetical protein